MFCLLPCSLASYHPDLASIWLPPGRLGKLSQLAFFRWLFFNFTFLVRDEGLGLTYTSLEMQTATELLQKRCFFCSFRCIYFNTAHKDGADSYKAKVWPTLQFPLLPFKILTNISYPLKKKSHSGQFGQTGDTSRKGFSRNRYSLHAGYFRLLQCWTAQLIFPLLLFSVQGRCWGTCFQEKPLRYEAPAGQIIPGSPPIRDVRSVSGEPFGWLAPGSCMANLDGSFYYIPLQQGKAIIFFSLGWGGL